MNLSGGKNSAGQIELNPVNGDLTLNGNIYNDNNLRYKVYGANQKLLTINTALGGNANVALDIEQYSKVNITKAQTMGASAAYNIKQGELWLSVASALAAGSTINLGQADANTAKLYLNGADDSHAITVANTSGTKVLGTLSASGTQTFSGNITLNGNVLLEATQSGATVDVTGAISGNSGVTITGTGTVKLSGNNTFTGGTTVNSGTLTLGNSDRLANSGNLTLNGGAFNMGGFSDTVATVTIKSGTISNGTLTGTSYLGESGTVSAILAGSGVTLSKSTTGQLNLSGANTYTGATTITAGSLEAQSAAALGSTAGNTTVSSGAELRLWNTGGLTYDAEALNLNGTGVGSAGALRNITNNNTWQGLVTLQSASRINSDSGTLTLDVASGSAITGNFQLNIGGAGNVTVNDNINISTAKLVKDGAGMLTLGGAMTYTGNTEIDQGTVAIGSGGSLASGSQVFIGNGGNSFDSTLALAGTTTFANNVQVNTGTGTRNIQKTDATSQTFSGTLTNNKASSIDVVTGGNLTISGIISGSGGITKTGQGTLLLGSDNSFTGGIVVNAGTLAINGTGPRLGSTGGVTNAAALTLNGGTFQVQSSFAISGQRGFTIGANGGTIDTPTGIDFGGPNIISGPGNTLTKTGAGTLYSSAANTIGGLIVSAGTFKAENVNALQNANVTLNGGSVTFGQSLTNFTFGGLTATNAGAGYNLALTNSATLSGAAVALTIGNNNVSSSYAGVLSGAGSIIKTGTGTFTVSGDNTYSGGTVINAGTVSLAKDLALGSVPGSASAANLSFGGGTLAVTTGFTLNSNRGITLNTGGGTIDVASGQTLTYGGVMAGANAFTKAGAGTLTLGGNNTFSGNVVVSAGTLSITNGNSLGSGQFNFGNGGTLTTLTVDSNNTITNTFRVYNAATNAVLNIVSGATTISGQLTQDAGLGKTNSTKFGKDGAGTLILNNASSDFTGQIQIGQGTVILGTNNALGTNVTTTARGVDLGLNVGDTAMGNNVSLLASNGVTVGQSIYVAPSNNATRTIGLSGTGTATFSNEIYLDANLAIQSGSNSTDGVVLSGRITQNQSNGATSYGLTKSDAGILTLSGSGSDFKNGVTMSAGTLRIGNANVLGDGTLTLNGGTLSSDSATVRSVTNAVTVGGDIGLGESSTGTGTLTLSGAVGLGSATRVLTVNTNVTITGIISGSGGITKTGQGTLLLDAANTFTGGIVVNAGTLAITNGSGARLGGITSNVTNPAHVTLNGGTLQVRQSFGILGERGITIGANGGTIDTPIGVLFGGPNIISGPGNTLTKTGTGTLYSSAANTIGGLIVSAGTFQADNANALQNANVTLNGGSLTFGLGLTGATIGGLTATNAGAGFDQALVNTNNAALALTIGNNNVSSTYAGVLSGAGSIIKTGTGTFTVSGNNTYSGGTTVNQGILQIQASNNMGTGGVTINSNAVLRATANLTNSRNITITTGQTGYVEAAAGTTNTLNGTLSKNGSVLVLGGGGTHIVNGSITGANASSDLVVSNSTTTINTANSYNGPTFIVAGGTLINGTNNALPTDTALTLGQSNDISSATNTYNLSGRDQTVASIAATGTAAANIITNSTGTANLTLSSAANTNISNLRMGGSGLTLTKSGANTVTLTSGNSIGPSTIAIQQGTLLLGASSQIGDTTAITMSGGTLDANGFSDVVGRLSFTGSNVSANLKGLNAGTTGNFVFSDLDTSSFGNLAQGGLVFSGGTNYDFNNGFRIQLSTVNLSTAALTTFNTYTDKVSFGVGQQTGAISFTGGGGTYLTVAAIPEPKVYIAAGALALLIAFAEVRRRKRATRAGA